VIDSDGFRPNVGIIIFNDDGRLLWAKRVGQDAWQFPQGGVQQDEAPEDAVLRELHEEVGLTPEDVEIVACTQDWLPYRLPHHLIRQNSHPVCIGQKQKWFLLKLVADTNKIKFDHTSKPEFDHWRWVTYWYPLNQVISFKRGVYRRALDELIGPLHESLMQDREMQDREMQDKEIKNRGLHNSESKQEPKIHLNNKLDKQSA
jgi:putative (di)nucleoside polyphosphate hydrolase